MTGVLGVFSNDRVVPDRVPVRRMASAMAARGAAHVDVANDGAAVLAVTRHDWELSAGFSGPVLVADEGDLCVAADASLYYQSELTCLLHARGVRAAALTPSHLIIAAYRAWGEECVARLEGDFAFILWDRPARRVLCARDFSGRRPLFHAQLGDTLLVASTISAILAHPDCPRELDLAAVGSIAAGQFAVGRQTCYRAVSALPAGSMLVRHEGATTVRRHWNPPAVAADDPSSFDDAAEHLRELLDRSVRERLSPDGSTGVWLSGGWDSTAVFGTAANALRDADGGRQLQAISVSFPPGDVGREDELITSVVDHCRSRIHWLDIQRIPLLDSPQERACGREEPFAHAFEMVNRALAEGTRSAGAHVAFDGTGGDQLFQVSPVYMSDLFRAGRWVQLAREWRLRRMSSTGMAGFFRWAVQPTLPGIAMRAATVVRRGRPLRGYLERPVPSWISPEFLRRHEVVERDRLNQPADPGRSRAAYETHWYLEHPYFPRAFSCVSSLALQSGVEMRSPLFDRRIVEFAVQRPREERGAGAETKRLLRRSMRGLLPDTVLAPRPYRTGMSGGYLDRSMRQAHAPVIEAILDAPLLLEELGVVDGSMLRRSWSAYQQHGTGGGNLAVGLFFTVQSELWLRAHAG
ncbi:MAG: asparagine synthetase B family protein [Gemmatimonadaceae bacterium]